MSLKIKISIQEGAESSWMSFKLTVPKKWRPGPASKLLEFAVETYNKKHPDSAVTLGEVHLDVEGQGIGNDDIIEVVIEKNDEVFVKAGPPPTIGDKMVALAQAEEQKEAAMELERAAKAEIASKSLCKNYGCAQRFKEEENHDTACRHHTAPPFFHECRKGWTCCKSKVAMDWEEFQQIPGCAVGRHSTVPPTNDIGLSPEQEVAKKEEAPTVKTIDGYNKSDEGKNAATGAKGFAASTGAKATVKIIEYPDGSFRCQNKGCQAKFSLQDNTPHACRFHAGTPVFHETYKYWSCCADKKKIDFDEFMQVPGCRVGLHWNGDGEAEQGIDASSAPSSAPQTLPTEEVVEAGADGFDLG